MGGQFLPPCGEGQNSASLARARLARRIDVGPSGRRIETAIDVLIDVRFAVDEVDRARRALEEIEIPVARDVDEALYLPAAALIVDEDRRRHFVPVPRLVGVVLEVALDLSGGDVDGHGGRDVEVVAGPLIAHPGAAVAGAPVGEVGGGIIVAGHPHRRAAGLPLIALRPRLAARLDRVPAPCRCATVPCRSLGIEGGDEPAHAELAAGGANHHLAIGDQRRQCRVVRRLVVGDRLRPHFTAAARVEGDQDGLAAGEEHLVAIQRRAAVRLVQHERAFRARPLVAPQHRTAARIECHQLVVRRRHVHHAVVDDGGGLVRTAFASLHHPHALQPADVGGRDLCERAVAPAVVGAADHQPVAVFRVAQPGGSHGLVVAQRGGRRRSRGRALLRRAGEDPRTGDRERDPDG